ncbi:unknown protein [Seminavis robusta]|uniref:Uncharacterized protein n=1 Tax=Seminavis robusta TaxID=568900 RepID=A0A9N8E2L4_9STRA|nr:unknown protein [Seminavis robusta]|eukprot:Sro590_g171950.1 n/a (183) ;mRNA; r:55014-55562
MAEFVDAVVAFGGPVWNLVLCVLPAAELVKMDDADTRHPCLSWRLASGAQFKCKCTSLEFLRFGNSTKYRFKAEGFLIKDGGSSGTVQSFELNLTMRAPWVTDITKLKGATSAVRMVEINFLIPKEDRKDNDVVRVEALVPITTDVDKGKLLKECIDWAKTVVDGNIRYRDLISKLPANHQI